MVISLYICEIPRNVDKSDLEDLFKSMDGYLEIRVKPTNDNRKIAFVDFKEERQAVFAMETLQGFKFSPEDRGLIVKVSDNSKSGLSGGFRGERGERGNRNNDTERKVMNKKRNRKDSRENNRNGRGRFNQDARRYKEEKSRSSSASGKSYDSRKRRKSVSESISRSSGDFNGKENKSGNLNKLNNLSNQVMSNIQSNIQGNIPSGQQTANNPPNILDIISLLSSTQNPSTNKPYTLPEQSSQQANLPSQTTQNLSNLNTLSNQQSSLNQPDFNNLLETLQTVQLFSSLSNPPIVPPKEATTPKIPKVSESSTLFLKNFNKFDDYFKSAIDFRRNATNIVYVEGLPNDATEREVAHLFRPFVGFKSVRLITREKNGQTSLICFADFENVMQSTICINTLQGYRFDKNDLIGLHFSYGVSKQRENRESRDRRESRDNRDFRK